MTQAVVYLTPVEVFGAEGEVCRNCGELTPGGYGLCDATSPWSDCNRAIGHIFRVEESPLGGNPENVSIRVMVDVDDLPKLRAWYGSPSDASPARSEEHSDG
jgi:hypothetical protein